jgi:hypothetical protein
MQVIDELAALVATRMDAWTGGTLATLAGRSGLRDDPGEALTLHLERHHEAIAAWLVDHQQPQTALLRWLRRRNQFVQLDAAAIAELAAIAGRARDGLLAAPRGEALRGALTRVAGTLRAELAEFVRTHLGAEPREVQCSEYSPTLQLEVLGLTVEMVEPVLDVGCGAAAALVHTLRAAGRMAEGIDREAPADAIVADWLQFDYGVDRWGTVISHLGFSLHLLHHHLAGRAAAFVHAEVYMQILRSLRVGGVFAYAPG